MVISMVFVFVILLLCTCLLPVRPHSLDLCHSYPFLIFFFINCSTSPCLGFNVGTL